MNKTIFLAVAALVGSALQAQTSYQFQGKLSIASAQGDLLSLTGKQQGHAFEGGIQIKLTQPELNLYVHGGHLVVRRNDVAGMNNADAKTTWVGLDLNYDVNERITIYTGPTLNSWDIVTKATGSYPDTNWHLGWRAGLGYQINAKWGVDACYSFSEWSRVQQKSVTGSNVGPVANQPWRINPAWFTVGATYKF